MDRYVHHRLRIVVSAGAATVVGAVVTCAVHGIPQVPHGKALWLPVGGVLAWLAVTALLKTSRIKHISEVRDFESAAPLTDPDTVPPVESFRQSQPFYLPFFLMDLVLLLGLSFLWGAWASLFPLAMALDRLGEAALAARWERRHGLLLWRGHLKEQPLGKDQFLYSSVRPWPPTRTATDAPPGSPTPPPAPEVPEDRRRTERPTT